MWASAFIFFLIFLKTFFKSVFDESKINELNEQLAREHLLQKSELADLDFEKLKKQSVLREMSEISYDKRVLEKKIADHEDQLAADKKLFAENLYDLGQ